MANEEKILSIQEMLDADDVEYVVVPVPEWGGSVRFGSIDAGSMLEFVERNAAPGGNKDSMIRLIVQCLVDADGVRVPDDEIEAKIALFKKKDVRVINRLAEAALTLNGGKVAPVIVKNALSEADSDASRTILH
jgi:hypothetical protein